MLYNEEVSPGYFRLGLEWRCKGVRPGHFVMVRVSDGHSPLLRRPFSVYDVFDATGRSSFSAAGIEILYKVVGEGTALMSSWVKGHEVDILGPLGAAPFPPVKAGEEPLLVAGGIGIAPFRLLARTTEGLTMYYGARSKEDASLAWGFRGTGMKIKVATEDGTVGKKGLVTALMDGVGEGTVIYACGPTPMLKAVSMLAMERGARCYVSMERTMACGMGACLGCALPAAAGGYLMVCKDGPVFESREVAWEKI